MQGSHFIVDDNNIFTGQKIVESLLFGSEKLHGVCKQKLIMTFTIALLQERSELPIKELDEELAAAGFSSKVCRSAKEELEAKGMIVRRRLSTQPEESGKKSVVWIIRLSEGPDPAEII